MIVQFHTPKGIVTINSDTVTDTDLANIGFTRDGFNAYLNSFPRYTPLPGTQKKIETLRRSWLNSLVDKEAQHDATRCY